MIYWQDLSYQERLTALSLETLENRRLSRDLTVYQLSLLFHRRMSRDLTMYQLSLLFHRVIFILFIVISIFVSHCIELIYLKIFIFFNRHASRHGAVCQVLSLIQSILLHLSVLLDLLICLHF